MPNVVQYVQTWGQGVQAEKNRKLGRTFEVMNRFLSFFDMLCKMVRAVTRYCAYSAARKIRTQILQRTHGSAKMFYRTTDPQNCCSARKTVALAEEFSSARIAQALAEKCSSARIALAPAQRTHCARKCLCVRKILQRTQNSSKI